MSILAALLRRLSTAFAGAGATHEPEMMSQRDWADLPAYHPVSDRAPC
ncbi:hypothetical protein [Devosia epidermidihirudinis]|nr:hypothetical protein [Devosia epidermidihirudinis]